MTAVVTGIGVVAPTGVGVPEFWDNTLRGAGAIGPIRRFDAATYQLRLAGEITDFTATDHMSSRLQVQTDRWTQFGLVAAEEALADAGALPLADSGLSDYDLAVVTASSSAGNEFGQGELSSLWRNGPDHVTPFQSIAWFYAATTGQISIRNGMRGPCGVLASEQAGGLDAIGQARRVLRSGTRLVVAGGAEAPLSPYAVVCQQANGLLCSESVPERGFLPFSPDANGYVPGEGAGMLILEDQDSATSRGVGRTYGQIAGYGATFDPQPGSSRGPTLARAAQLALADAGLTPSDVDVVFADAAGVRSLDAVEAAAIEHVFGRHGVPVTAPKVLTGRVYAGGAAIDIVTALLAMRDSVIPPTPGIEPAEEYGLDLIGARPREARLDAVLVLARGFGGFNSAVVVTTA
ncbi:MAG TPA: ketosynthase chain-length factor [Pseudonocardiaceae bacterium]